MMYARRLIKNFRRRVLLNLVVLVVVCSLVLVPLFRLANYQLLFLSIFRPRLTSRTFQAVEYTADTTQANGREMDCVPPKHVQGFVQIPASLAKSPISAIQRQLKGFVEFEGCNTPHIPTSTVIGKEQWSECCQTYGNFSGHEYPRDTEGRAYMPDPSLTAKSAKNTNSTSSNCFKSDKILLVVLYNHEFYQNTELLRELYADAFGGVVFYGPKANAIYHITGIDIHKGHFLHRAIAQAMIDYPHYGGYLWIGDDVFMNYPVLLTRYVPFSDRMWIMPLWKEADVFNESQYIQQMSHVKMGALSIAEACVPKQYVKRMQCLCPYAVCVRKQISDAGYVPSRFANRFIEMAYAFRNTFEELALPTLLEIITDNVKTDIIRLSDAIYLWGESRLDLKLPFRIATGRNVTFIHPFKLSFLALQKDAHLLLNISKSRFPCL